MTRREVLRKLLDNSAGCVCIEYKEGECPCEKEIDQALSALREVVLSYQLKYEQLDMKLEREKVVYNRALEDIADALTGEK